MQCSLERVVKAHRHRGEVNVVGVDLGGCLFAISATIGVHAFATKRERLFMRRWLPRTASSRQAGRDRSRYETARPVQIRVPLRERNRRSPSSDDYLNYEASIVQFDSFK